MESPTNEPTMDNIVAWTLGRSSDNDVTLSDPQVSGTHARVLHTKGRWFVQDLRSTNGTWLDGQRLAARIAFEILPGQVLRLGQQAIVSLPLAKAGSGLSSPARTLGDQVVLTGSFDHERAAGVLGQIVTELAFRHAQGRLRPSLSPHDTLLVDPDGTDPLVMMLDALERFEDSRKSIVEYPIPYAAPEQFCDQPLCATRDVYALGLLAYEMLTAAFPFKASTAWEWATCHLTVNPDTSDMATLPSARRAIERALMKVPEERHPTVINLYEDLFPSHLAGPEQRAFSSFLAADGDSATSAPPAAAAARSLLTLPHNERRILLVTQPKAEQSRVASEARSSGILAYLAFKGRQALAKSSAPAGVVTVPYDLGFSGLTFPPGHPHVDSLYVVHPHIPTRYLAYDGFHRVLFAEKRDELLALLANLGATRVRLTTRRGNRTKAGASVAVAKGAELSTSAKGEKVRLEEEFSEEHFRPEGRPTLHKVQIWFPHETSWQALADRRLELRMIKLKGYLKYEDSFGIDGSLKVGFENLGIKLGGSYGDFESTEWEFEAEFGDFA